MRHHPRLPHAGRSTVGRSTVCDWTDQLRRKGDGRLGQALPHEHLGDLFERWNPGIRLPFQRLGYLPCAEPWPLSGEWILETLWRRGNTRFPFP